MIQLTFKNQGIIVDYLSFNILDTINYTSLARYLFEDLHFNVSVKKTYQSGVYDLHYDSKNNHYVTFVESSSPRSKIIKVNFKGDNANYFYSFIFEDKVDWKEFGLSNPNLSRIDFCYSREMASETLDKLNSFLTLTYDNILNISVKRCVEITKNGQGQILTIGSRKSDNFCRIYQKATTIRFELELKNAKARWAGDLLFDKCISDFEHALTIHFFKHFQKVLPTENSELSEFCGWVIGSEKKLQLLSTFFRQVDNQYPSKNEKKIIYLLLQFLTYSHQLKSYKKYAELIPLQRVCYNTIEFELGDFMQYLGGSSDMTKRHYRRKAKDILFSLQKIQSIVDIFEDDSFQRIAAFPAMSVKKENKQWIARVAIVEKLHKYDYPFKLPSTFTSYQNDHDMLVKFQLIRAISSHSQKKAIQVRSFLAQFKLSNQKRAKIALLFLKNLSLLDIETTLHFTTNNRATSVIDITQLNLALLYKIDTLYFYERID